MEQKHCADCIYYAQYYVKHGLRFHTVAYGHCRKSPSAKKLNGTCKLFCERNREQEKEETMKSVNENLNIVVQQIYELLEMLKN